MANKTDKQLLRDPDIQPTAEVIAEGLGDAYTAYVKFLEGLKPHGITLMEWRYYNDGKAWLSKGEYNWTTSRGTPKIKPIFWLSVWESFFKVSFFFSSQIRDELLFLPVSSETKELIKNVNPMGNTQRFMPVVLDITSDIQLQDVYELAQFRKIKMK